MKNFIFKVTIFTASLGIFYIFPLIIILIGKESFSGRDAAIAQKQDPKVLVGFAYGVQSFSPYKTALMQERSATIIALGTSRVMQFRKEFFRNEDDFVNVGGAITSITDLKSFIDTLPDTSHKDRTIILGLDQDIFLKLPTDTGARKGDKVENKLLLRVAYILAASSRDIYLDEFSKYTIFTLLEKVKTAPHIGIMALIKGDGFRSDGSRQYHQTISNPNLENWVKEDIQKRVNEIRSDTYSTPNEDERIESNVERLSAILDICQKKHIKVIGFMPPYNTKTYDAMENSNSSYRKILNSLPKKLEDTFTMHSFLFYNFSNINSFGGKDVEFIDFIHGSDLMYAKIILAMLQRDPSLANIFDGKKLKSIIKITSNNIHLSF